MKKILNKKIGSLLAVSGVVAGMMLAYTPVFAGENDPQIEHVLHRGRKSVEFQIEDDRFQEKKVRIKMEVFDIKTGVLVKTKNYVDRLDESGQTKVRIGKLMPDTEYKFKLRVREHGKSKDYKQSDSKTVKTKSE